MCPCSPLDVSIDLPSGPSGPAIPGFGVPFAINIPNINPFPDGFPEDLLSILDKLQMLIPPGVLKPSLNPNFGKDIFDAIMKVLDQFLPFLMLYKFFLPILKLLLCIIEVLCALKNPFKLRRAIKKLFRNCIPDFLNLFPIFAIIMMIISLLLLILALIEYIIQQIIKFIKAIIRNILALQQALRDDNEVSILAIAKKLGSLLCIFQNLFVLFAVFNIIIQVFKDILSLAFAIPPCDDTNPADENGCCTPDVCPDIVKTEYQRYTGKLQYLNKVSFISTVPFLPPPFGSPSGNLMIDMRTESWQLYDENQELAQRFSNIYDAYDVVTTPKPVFFPTDVVYSAGTPARQAAYTLDLRFFYDPTNWSRDTSVAGQPRWVQFKNCIMSAVPSPNLLNYNNETIPFTNGVVKLAGGIGYEDDGKTILMGFGDDGITPSVLPATLENFIHKPASQSASPTLLPTDGYLINEMEYIFKPNLDILFSKDIITSGCIPDIAQDRVFVNNVLVGDANLALDLLVKLINSDSFPNPAKTQECLSTAIAGLRGNLTLEGAAQFQATSLVCLQKLKDDTNKALGDLIGIGFDPCKSTYTANPKTQFTSRQIEVTVNINERNGTSLTSTLTPTIAEDIAKRIKPHIDLGEITSFNYDGYQIFTAMITSAQPGIGHLSISFDDQIFCTNTLPSDINEVSTHTLQQIEYQFVYTPTAGSSYTGEGDNTAQPRRNEGDLARDINKGSV